MRSLLLTLLVLLLVPAAADADRAYVLNGMGVPPITVFDTATNAVVQTIGTRGDSPSAGVASPNGRRVYIGIAPVARHEDADPRSGFDD